MKYTQIECEIENGIANIKLNMPGKLNALSLTMGDELMHAIDLANENARVIVLGSHGRAFCSGANLSDTGNRLQAAERDIGSGLETVFNPLMLRMRDAKVPLITAVKGAAAGIGCSIALMGDLIVTGKSAYFLQAFRNIGLIPDGGSAYLLAHSIGRVRAMQMMLLGKKLYAEQALAYGLVNDVVDDDKIDEIAMEYAVELAQGPTIALGLLRKSAWAALDNKFQDQLQLERELQFAAGQSNDFAEGVSAFLGKRKAEFKGD
ncbi:MAG: 2-(1 2-epoxy-1 2-dihydrophenyl)acetyl-CoA isomerase [Hyphomonadaceae bacterium]|nr:MAG: 2-(1 2-epoxy-1 2-dihydrophenyl)acetyl-CoA isomerase [Hyphomonadaceae bacterium]KAF0187131.1 MAG: 2-(1 2-epoxy-1 2-dihydrophenyl)acetyl-CoA isomerase [Hyphomonadaceae bacterium]